MTFTVRQGHRYRAHVHLGLFEQVVSDNDIAQRLVAAGFIDVSVVGEGRERWAFGTWRTADATAELPSQIVAVQEI